jgi:hypothetical protein
MRIMLLPVAILLAPAVAFGQASPNDVDYCNRLADLYVHYIGRSEFDPYHAIYRGSNDTQIAAAQCRQGITGPAIPVLERVLLSNGFTLPPRG